MSILIVNRLQLRIKTVVVVVVVIDIFIHLTSSKLMHACSVLHLHCTVDITCVV